MEAYNAYKAGWPNSIAKLACKYDMLYNQLLYYISRQESQSTCKISYRQLIDE